MIPNLQLLNSLATLFWALPLIPSGLNHPMVNLAIAEQFL